MYYLVKLIFPPKRNLKNDIVLRHIESSLQTTPYSFITCFPVKHEVFLSSGCCVIQQVKSLYFYNFIIWD